MPNTASNVWDFLKSLPKGLLAGLLIALLIAVLILVGSLSYEVHQGRDIDVGKNGLKMRAKEDPKITNCKIIEGKLTGVEQAVATLNTNDQHQIDELQASLKELQKRQDELYPENPVTAIRAVQPQIDQTQSDIVTHVGTLSEAIKSLTQQISNIRQLCSLLDPPRAASQ
jgi:peptidoglycan hydrolase CwlO-like protein